MPGPPRHGAEVIVEVGLHGNHRPLLAAIAGSVWEPGLQVVAALDVRDSSGTSPSPASSSAVSGGFGGQQLGAPAVEIERVGSLIHLHAKQHAGRRPCPPRRTTGCPPCRACCCSAVNSIVTRILRKSCGPAACAQGVRRRLRGADVEDFSAAVAHFANPAFGGHRLAFGRIVAWITNGHGEVRQEFEPAPHRSQGRVMGQQGVHQLHEVVRLGDGKPKFLKQRL